MGDGTGVADEASGNTQQPPQQKNRSMTKIPAYSGTRHLCVILTSVLAASLLAGCATSTGADTSAEAPYCYKTSKGRVVACTRVPAPSLNADAQAKRFTPDPNALTVYVVRRNWGDGGRFVKISADNEMAAETLPNTMVRFKLKPGTHTFTLDFEGQRQVATVMVKLVTYDFFGSMERFGHGRARLYGRLTARMQFGKGLTRLAWSPT